MYFTETAAGRNDKGATPRPNQGGGTASQAGTRGATSPLEACTGEQRPRSGGEGKKKEKKMGRRHIQYRATHRSEAQRPREECNQGRERNGGGQCGRRSPNPPPRPRLPYPSHPGACLSVAQLLQFRVKLHDVFVNDLDVWVRRQRLLSPRDGEGRQHGGNGAARALEPTKPTPPARGHSKPCQLPWTRPRVFQPQHLPEPLQQASPAPPLRSAPRFPPSLPVQPLRHTDVPPVASVAP